MTWLGSASVALEVGVDPGGLVLHRHPEVRELPSELGPHVGRSPFMAPAVVYHVPVHLRKRMKTFSPKPKDITRSWFVVDAQGAVLGRLASEVAKVLRGKHKPTYAPHLDTGDHVIVTNAAGIRVSGGKESNKIYYRHSRYPGGLRETPFDRELARHPERVVETAIRGMLPKNRLGRQMAKKLHVYAGSEHPHAAQAPTPLKLGEVPGTQTGERNA